MTAAQTKFEEILDKFIDANEDVKFGKMMTAPALKKNGKVVAFFHDGQMTFKLGKGRDLQKEFGITEFSHLSPFKNKPPMTAWYEIGYEYVDLWEALTSAAMESIK